MIRPLLIGAILAAAPPACFAGDLTPAAANEVVSQIEAGLDGYFDPAVGRKARAAVEARRADYAKLDSREAFAKAVSADLYAATHDLHLKVSLATNDAGRNARLTDKELALVDRHTAYGLSAVRRLPGNIGYLKLSYLEQTEKGAALVDTLMDLLKDTDALIIDLRQNRGGGGGADEELLGHLSRTPIPMAKITWRNPDGTAEVMQRRPTSPSGGPLYPDKPVFVLISKTTFSAAEGVAYDLQASKRAVMVGETSGGGANPSNRPVPISYGLRFFVPNGHVEHPTTHANWEGVGVVPEIVTAPGDALTTAYAKALMAAKPLVSTPKSDKERADAIADPKAALVADQAL